MGPRLIQQYGDSTAVRPMRDRQIQVAVAVQVGRHRESRVAMVQSQHVERVEQECTIIKPDLNLERRPTGDRNNQILITIAVDIRDRRKRQR